MSCPARPRRFYVEFAKLYVFENILNAMPSLPDSDPQPGSASEAIPSVIKRPTTISANFSQAKDAISRGGAAVKGQGDVRQSATRRRSGAMDPVQPRLRERSQNAL